MGQGEQSADAPAMRPLATMDSLPALRFPRPTALTQRACACLYRVGRPGDSDPNQRGHGSTAQRPLVTTERSMHWHSGVFT